jgi:hypothetical protein
MRAIYPVASLLPPVEAYEICPTREELVCRLLLDALNQDETLFEILPD